MRRVPVAATLVVGQIGNRVPRGLGIALACDIVVAAEDAVFGTPEVDVGLWPYMITVPMLRSMPPKVVLELQMTGRRVAIATFDAAPSANEVLPMPGRAATITRFDGWSPRSRPSRSV